MNTLKSPFFWFGAFMGSMLTYAPHPSIFGALFVTVCGVGFMLAADARWGKS